MTTTVKCKSDLDTPCLVLDMDILERNLQKMQAAADGTGKLLLDLRGLDFCQSRMGNCRSRGRSR